MPIPLQRVTSLRRCAQTNAPASSYCLRRVVDDGVRGAGGWSGACYAPLLCCFSVLQQQVQDNHVTRFGGGGPISQYDHRHNSSWPLPTCSMHYSLHIVAYVYLSYCATWCCDRLGECKWDNAINASKSPHRFCVFVGIQSYRHGEYYGCLSHFHSQRL